MIVANKYRSHTCGELRAEHVGSKVRLAGWVDGIRDHGGVIFLDLRDQYGLVQVVIHDEKLMDGVSREAVITVYGDVVARSATNVNPKLATGEVELHASELELLGRSVSTLPFEVENSTDIREDLRLRYRFLDLRNKKVRDNLNLRANVVAEIRHQMASLGFLEVTTPILTASSPEGARDYLIPSRKHPGQFYALPQAPQIFKQLLMVSGVDRYFQIAPCFRDEDARADRSPGEFYQLDFEMAFATQEDVLSTAEQVMYAVFTKYSDSFVSPAPFPRIPYSEAMLRYGSDKPDLRNPLVITELSDLFVGSDFKAFAGKTVRGIAVPGAAAQPRSFFDQMGEFASSIGMQGLGYIKVEGDGGFQGPIDKFLSDAQRAEITTRCGLAPDCALFFIADSAELAPKLAGQIRTELGKRLDLIEKNSYRFCYVVDFPMYELDEETGTYAFVHNPFSMPQGGLEALTNKDPLELLAHQYDIVCNGVELSSGAVRNHDVEIMKKAFEIAGYPFEVLEKKFGSLYTAFQYGAPPHAGMAPGIDRIVMLLAGTDNIRDIIAFPMTANAQDLLMGAPGEVTAQQLREVHIAIREPEKV